MVGDQPGEPGRRQTTWICNGDQFYVDVLEHDEPVRRTERMCRLGSDHESNPSERRSGRIQVVDGEDEMIELGHFGMVRLRVDR